VWRRRRGCGGASDEQGHPGRRAGSGILGYRAPAHERPRMAWRPFAYRGGWGERWEGERSPLDQFRGVRCARFGGFRRRRPVIAGLKCNHHDWT
jgi:hypothetical protein